MNSKSFYIIFFISLFYANKLSSQNLTGTWEGLMGDEYLQINIVQENDQLCGYTYDYVLNEKRNYCKAYFKGYYDKKQRTWTISGVSFIENSGSHILMHIKLWRNSGDGYDRLAGREIPKSALDFVLSLGSMESLDLKKVSAYPTPLPDNMPPCFSEEKTIKDSVVNETRPLKPADTARVIRKTNKKIRMPQGNRLLLKWIPYN